MILEAIMETEPSQNQREKYFESPFIWSTCGQIRRARKNSRREEEGEEQVGVWVGKTAMRVVVQKYESVWFHWRMELKWLNQSTLHTHHQQQQKDRKEGKQQGRKGKPTTFIHKGKKKNGHAWQSRAQLVGDGNQTEASPRPDWSSIFSVSRPLALAAL